MTAQKSVDIGNAHLDTVIDYTKSMVDAERVEAERAPAFMTALSDAIMGTVQEFGSTAVAGPANVGAKSPADILFAVKDIMESEASVEVKGKKMHKHSKTAKMREALTKEGKARKSLPVVAAAFRFVSPKRGVGRPRKDAPKPVVTDEQKAFDRAFRRNNPPVEGWTKENSVADDGITIAMDGTKMLMIGRYLKAAFNITPDDYRRIYGLGEKYPTCAPGYSAIRSGHAKRQGLGTEKVAKTPRARKAAKVVSIATPKSLAEAAPSAKQTVAA